MRHAAVAIFVTFVLPCVLPAAALAEDVALPSPQAARAQQVTALCAAAGGLPDRCRPSVVPGDVRNDEAILVGLDGSGTPAKVLLDQNLTLQGVGDYAIRERGP